MKRRVGTVDVVGLPFTVYLADEAGQPLLQEAYAVCFPGKQEIVLSVGLSREMRWMHLMHEVLHGIWAHAGCGDIVRGSKPAHLEEIMIRALTPHIVRAMASAHKGVRW
jgi:hypothetical protein